MTSFIVDSYSNKYYRKGMTYLIMSLLINMQITVLNVVCD